MEKNQRNPRRRLNSLILLVAFTAVMLIVSTYAWFTAQKTVMIGNLQGKVNVAEGIEISLDAVNWSQEIDFSDYYTNTDVGQYNTSLNTVYGSVAHNVTPSELLPVSATGKNEVVNSVTGGKEVAFYNGKSAANSSLTPSTTKLSEIIATDPTKTSSSDAAFAGYFAIDLFLRNSSKLGTGETQGTAMETLQLNTTSTATLVTSGTPATAATGTGLQNTLRVALALYQPDTTDATTQSVSVTETSQDKILAALTGADINIQDVAIWEPNADQHVDEILQNNNKIKWTDDDADLYLTTSVEMGTPATAKVGKNRIENSTTHLAKFVAGEILPTYALTSSSVSTTIDDVYDWDGSVTTVAKQIALQTKKSAADYTTVDGGVRNLISSKTSTGEDIYEYGYGSKTTASDIATGTGITAETGAAEFQIYKNQISRIRMYVWLEGQDVDCTNYASHGAGIDLDLGLVKGAKVGGMAES